jgi:hypothetical protein
MGDVQLLTEDELPARWRYPAAFLRFVRHGLTDLEPWYILEGEPLRVRTRGLRERYPSRVLLPFARRSDCDDGACWDAREPVRVQLIHDFAAPGWEQRETLPDFYAWIRRAVEDMIEFDSLEPD